MIHFFEDEQLGSALTEVRSAGCEFSLDVLAWCDKLLKGAIDHRRLELFATCNGAEVFLGSIGRNVVAVALGADEAGPTVTILFAGLHGVAATCGPTGWDGLDYDALRTGIVQVRCAAWFT